MQNLSNFKMSHEQRRFIDDLAALLTPWGMPITVARLYGYLQIRNNPASLDEIAADLGVSKSNACTAAKILEQHENARRISERGTKRVLYVAGNDPSAPLRQQRDLLGRMAALIAARKGAVANGEAAARLGRLAAFHLALQSAMAGVSGESEGR